MGERDDARHQVEQKRERMSRIAHEVSRRMTPEYAKGRARDMARRKAMRMRDSAVENSWFAPLLGAGIGALVAKAMQSRSSRSGEREWYGRDDRYYGYGYGQYGYGTDRFAYGYDDPRRRYAPGVEASSEGGGLSDKASELTGRASQAASEMKDRVTAKTEEVRESLHERTSALRERIPDRERVYASAHEDSGIWALGAMALGALFGLALPVSEREREMLEPAARKARELGQQAKDMAVDKSSAVMDQAVSGIEGTHQRASHDAGAPESSPTPIH